MRGNLLNWLLFIVLSIIWGSSFVLMKEGMRELSAYQVASLRMLSAGIVLLPFAIKSFRQIPKNKLGLVILSGIIGAFFPAFLFCVAEQRIDSSFAGILNALTPLFTIMLGVSFFNMKATSTKWLGIFIGFAGLVLLPFAGTKEVLFNDMAYAGLVIIATILYGLNVNLVGKYLHNTGSLNIAAVAFPFLIIPAAFIFFISGNINVTSNAFWISVGAGCVLGIFGTAVATILFYVLLKRAGSLFASMVTYGIPFIAVAWGLVYNESITLLQVGCLGIILCGVYLTSKNKKTNK